SGVLTIGLPGVSAWKRAARVLKSLGAKTARVAIDADASRNRNVANSLFQLAHHLRKHGFTVELEVWAEADGKGIDDLLAAKKSPEVLTGDLMLAAIESIRAAADTASPAPTANGAGVNANGSRPEIVITTEEHEVNAAATAALAGDNEILQRGGQLVRVVHDTSPAAHGIRRPHVPRIDALPAPVLRERFAAAALWFNVRDRGEGKE